MIGSFTCVAKQSCHLGLVAAALAIESSLLAGCGGSAAPGALPYAATAALTAPTALGLPPDAKSGETLYATLSEGDYFSAYKVPGKKKPFCTNSHLIRGEQNAAGAVATDSAGNLWIPTYLPTTSNPSVVYSYGPDCGAPGSTLTAPSTSIPEAVAVGRDGTKYVLLKYDEGGSYYESGVAVFPAGASKPSAELTDPHLNGSTWATAVAVSKSGEVYAICCAGSGPAFAIEFDGQESQQQGTQISLQGVTNPTSAAFDRKKRMLVTGQNGTLNVYAAPYTGTPTTYQLQGEPAQCALSPSEKLLACDDWTHLTADVYAYPSVTYRYKLDASISYISLTGVAFAPK